ncbi:MAG TPA: VOC family protein [Polyangiales bacterium]|nr:VOC family protein [Polyangiales bacterium]
MTQSGNEGATQHESLGIQRIASLHIFVRDLERSRDHYIDKLDFAEVAVSTPEFERAEKARASVLAAGNVHFVFMEPLGSNGESFHWLEKHPEGVGRVVFDVDDAARAYDLLCSRGATPITGLERRHEPGESEVVWFDIATAFGDTLFRFMQHDGRGTSLPHLPRLPAPRGGQNRFGISTIDHITTNFLTLQPALSWMEQVMGFERFWEIEFHTQDVAQEKKAPAEHAGSGLKSVVMWDPHSGLKFANNEPAQPHFKSSQIYLFYLDHRGAGIQHVALSVPDLVSTVQGLRSRGVEFMPTPSTYYDLLPARLKDLGVNDVEEDVDTLRKLEILVDGHAHRRYMLQIFMKEAAALFGDKQAGPLFIELLQRKGDDGFGGGNFRALFESIERQQQGRV